ncbi:unnamed protein product, partial [Ectocarpus sp. 12 AP-2014]
RKAKWRCFSPRPPEEQNNIKCILFGLDRSPALVSHSCFRLPRTAVPPLKSVPPADVSPLMFEIRWPPLMSARLWVIMTRRGHIVYPMLVPSRISYQDCTSSFLRPPALLTDEFTHHAIDHPH